MHERMTARMARWQVWLLCVSGGALWLSGVVWLWLHYFLQTAGEFGPQINPLEPWMLRLHGFFLLPLLLGVGGLFVAHIPKGWRQRRQRLVGIVLSSVLAVLMLSGYLLYYLGDETWRPTVSLAHWGIGCALPAIFLWHYLPGRRLRRRLDTQR